ncbi:MAG TPA: transglycosylase SLT domain-containing protein [Burkholderiales bacterium]|nr:transglycosylase SLT domain-containing protein [Burkholderiales bacterium]
MVPPRTLLLLVVAVVMATAAWVLEQHEISGVPAAPAAFQAVGQPDAAPVAAVAVPAAAPAPAEISPGRVRALAEFLAKRYRVSQSITLDLVQMAHSAGHQIGLDPLLIIAVMAVESRFNPIAESVAGAKGLMQVIPKYHVDKFREFGGEKYAVFDPETNILVGTRILKDYLAQTGSLNSALTLYVGASDAADVPYIEKVMTEKQRLLQVLRSKPARPAHRDVEASAPLAGERFASVH